MAFVIVFISGDLPVDRNLSLQAALCIIILIPRFTGGIGF